MMSSTNLTTMGKKMKDGIELLTLLIEKCDDENNSTDDNLVNKLRTFHIFRLSQLKRKDAHLAIYQCVVSSKVKHTGCT